MSSDEGGLKVVFMGTPAFAADILEELSHHEDVVCAYTRPDKVRGRGSEMQPSPVKERAEALGIPVVCTSSFKDPTLVDGLRELAPDVICVAAFGAILPPDVLAIPPLGCINVHASILPRWRGAAPVERAILAGDAETGVSIMQMEEGLDTGDVCIVRRLPIEGLSAQKVTDELAVLGSNALVSALVQARSGALHWTPQDDEGAVYAEKIAKRELDLAPGVSALEDVRRVLASSSAHPAKCRIGKRILTVLEASPSEDASPACGVAQMKEGHLLLGCAKGAIELLRVKPDGKREMAAKDFAAGLPGIKEGLEWGAA